MNPLVPNASEVIAMALGTLLVLTVLVGVTWWAVRGIVRDARRRTDDRR